MPGFRTYTIDAPVGTGSDADFFIRLQKILDQFQIQDSTDISCDHTPRGVRLYLRNPSIQSGGSGASQERGEYDPTASYNLYDKVVISGGSNAGYYLCVQPNSGQAPQLPDTGNLYWINLDGNVPAGGNWMS